MSFWALNTALVFGLFFVLTQIYLYRWTGSLYAEGEGFRLDSLFGGQDNRIPFVPQMAVFYLFLYYPWIFFTMLYFAFVAYRWGPAFGLSLLLAGLISTAVYVFFPVSVYWWRRELLAEPLSGNFWAETMYRYYERDTSFNCFPSMHAAESTTATLVWLKYCRRNPSSLSMVAAAGSAFLAVAVVLSTLFVKQHYIADAIAGVIIAAVVTLPVFKLFLQRGWPFIYRSSSRRPRGTRPDCAVSHDTWLYRRFR